MALQPLYLLFLCLVTKFILYMVCRKVDSPSIQALSLDHRNDVLSNTIALIFGYIGECRNTIPKHLQIVTHVLT